MSQLSGFVVWHFVKPLKVGGLMAFAEFVLSARSSLLCGLGSSGLRLSEPFGGYIVDVWSVVLFGAVNICDSRGFAGDY